MLILIIFCQDISVNIFNNVPFQFALLRTQMKTMHYFHIRIILEKEDVLHDPDEVFEVFVDIDSNLSMSKDAYLALVARSS